jgi:hypothetical protein
VVKFGRDSIDLRPVAASAHGKMGNAPGAWAVAFLDVDHGAEYFFYTGPGAHPIRK